jgi:hypothetical protein
MDCPRCNRPTTVIDKKADGTQAVVCPQCGWGRERAEETTTHARRRLRDVRAGEWLRLGLVWVFALGLVFGPYFGLLWLRDWLEMERGWTFLLSAEALREGLNPAYWIVTAVYLALAGTFAPKADLENLGWMGVPGVNNPFSYEDDVNRRLLMLALVLMPGHLAWAAPAGTWRVVKIALGKG